MQVDHVLHLGPCTVCEGDIHAPEGLILGEGAIVQGDVYTDGEVQLGPDARIEGKIRPTEDGPRGGLGTQAESLEVTQAQAEPKLGRIPVSGAAPQPVEQEAPLSAEHGEAEIQVSALRSTFQLLVDLAYEHGPGRDADGRVWGLRDDALDDMIKGVLVLVSDVHLDELPEVPWPPRIVREVLFGRALASVTEVSAKRGGTERFVLQVRRPPGWETGPGTRDWRATIVDLVQRIGQAARPSMSVERVPDEDKADLLTLVVDL